MKILVSAAKTGGHIFPAIAVGNELKHNGHDIVFIGSGAPIEINALKKQVFVTTSYQWRDSEVKIF